jgi:hypothetical protein
LRLRSETIQSEVKNKQLVRAGVAGVLTPSPSPEGEGCASPPRPWERGAFYGWMKYFAYICGKIFLRRIRMTTMSIDILNNDALRLLHDMEYLRLIRMRTETDESKTKQQSLSERFAGALHLSNEQYEEFQTALEKSRSEWERNI